MQHRVYLLDFVPEGLSLTPTTIGRLFRASDLCVSAPDGVPLGATVNIDKAVRLSGDAILPAPGRMLRCVGHTDDGKIALLEDSP